MYWLFHEFIDHLREKQNTHHSLITRTAQIDFLSLNIHLVPSSYLCEELTLLLRPLLCNLQTKGKYPIWDPTNTSYSNFSIAIFRECLEYPFIIFSFRAQDSFPEGIFWRQLSIHSPEYDNVMGMKCEH